MGHVLLLISHCNAHEWWKLVCEHPNLKLTLTLSLAYLVLSSIVIWQNMHSESAIVFFSSLTSFASFSFSSRTFSSSASNSFSFWLFSSSFLVVSGSFFLYGRDLGFVGIFPTFAFFSAYKSFNNCLQEQL
jgi:hypothetical protein